VRWLLEMPAMQNGLQFLGKTLTGRDSSWLPWFIDGLNKNIE
jgi:hypothetical protein